MKIGYVLNIFPALSETFVANEILGLKEKGFDIRIFAEKRQDYVKFEKGVQGLADKTYYFNENNAGIFRKVYLHLYFFFRSPNRYIKAVLFVDGLKDKDALWRFRQSVFLAKEIVDAKVRHIHAHFANLASEHAMLVSKLTGIPYSFTAHAAGIFVNPQFLKQKIDNAKFVVSISNYNKDYLIKNYPGIDGEKIKIVHCGVKISQQERLTKRESDSFTILSVGRLVKKKGFQYLIDACRILCHANGTKFRCEIIGAGVEKENLRQAILSHRLEDTVKLLGSLEHEDVLKRLGNANMFVLPSITGEDNNAEGIPVSLIEAMATGIPVVSTRITGIPELVKDGAGILVNEKDTEGLSEAVRKIYLLKEDERRQMGEKGKRIVETTFNLKKNIEKFSQLVLAKPDKEWADPDEKKWEGHPWKGVFAARTDFARAFCKGAVVLDAGCGVGWSTRHISEVAMRVIAVDFSEEALDRARKNHWRENIIYKNMNVLNLNVESESVDAVVALEMIEHFDLKEVVKFLSEISRVLKRGGLIVGSTPVYHSKLHSRKLISPGLEGGHRVIYTKRGLEKLLSREFKDIVSIDMQEGYLLFYGRKKGHEDRIFS